MGHHRRHLRALHRILRRRLSTRQTSDEERNRTTGVSQSTSPHIHIHLHLHSPVVPNSPFPPSAPQSNTSPLPLPLLIPKANHSPQWLIPRRQRLAFYIAHPHLPNPYANDIRYQNQAFYRPGYGDSRAHGHGYGYPMNQMPPPPPAYGQEDWVPAYSANPPVGATKVAADQGGGVGVREVGVEQGQGSGGQAQNHPGGDLGQAHVR